MKSIIKMFIVISLLYISACTSKNNIRITPISENSRDGTIYLFRPDTKSIIGIAEIPFVYHDGIKVGRLNKGCFLEIPAHSGINIIEIKASFLTFIPFYLLGKKEIEINSKDEVFILFAADVDQAHKFGPKPPATQFFFVDKDIFLKYKEKLILCK